VTEIKFPGNEGLRHVLAHLHAAIECLSDGDHEGAKANLTDCEDSIFDYEMEDDDGTSRAHTEAAQADQEKAEAEPMQQEAQEG
jgi:hypothetical protein